MAGAKGFATWSPQQATKTRLDEALGVIMAGRPDWPLGQRYWLYRLMGMHGWEKFDEYGAAAYRKGNKGKSPPREPYNLNHILDRGRRAGIIPWEAVVATRGMHLEAQMSESPAALVDVVEGIIQGEQFDRQAGQARRVVLWMETEGLAPTMQRTANKFGAPVLAGKGFDVIGRKYDFARTVVADGRPTLVLHAGDLDKSGHTVKTSLDADLSAFIDGLGGDVEFQRIALLEEQVYEYGLAYTEVSSGLNRGNHGAGYTAGIECQLEAMDIADIRSIVEEAFVANLDMDLYRQQVEREEDLRAEAVRIFIERMVGRKR